MSYALRRAAASTDAEHRASRPPYIISYLCAQDDCVHVCTLALKSTCDEDDDDDDDGTENVINSVPPSCAIDIKLASAVDVRVRVRVCASRLLWRDVRWLTCTPLCVRSYQTHLTHTHTVFISSGFNLHLAPAFASKPGAFLMLLLLLLRCVILSVQIDPIRQHISACTHTHTPDNMRLRCVDA